VGRLRNYDDLLDPSPLRFIANQTTFEFTPEAPIAQALEWIDYNTNPERMEDETKAERMERNYRLVFGDETYDQMLASKVGSRTMDAMYLDLLEDWSLFSDPDRKRREAGVRPVSAILEELREALLITEDTAIAEAAAEMAASVENMLESVEEPVEGE